MCAPFQELNLYVVKNKTIAIFLPSQAGGKHKSHHACVRHFRNSISKRLWTHGPSEYIKGRRGNQEQREYKEQRDKEQEQEQKEEHKQERKKEEEEEEEKDKKEDEEEEVRRWY